MVLSRQQSTTSKPLSIKEISAQAAQFDFSPNVALQRWIRAAKMLLTEAALCEQDGNLQKAYLYLVRHADLVLERLPYHPDYRDPHFKTDLTEAQRAVQRNFHKLDDWRPGLVQQHERYESDREGWEVERQRFQQEPEASRQYADQSRRRSAAFEDDTDAYENYERTLSSGQQNTLAVDPAYGEPRRRGSARQSTRQAVIPPATAASRQRGTLESENGEARHDSVRRYQRYDGDDSGVRDVGRHLRNQQTESRRALIPARGSTSSHTYNYPSVPAREEAIDWRTTSLQPSTARNLHNDSPPDVPAKDSYDHFSPPLPPRPTGPPLPHSTTFHPSSSHPHDSSPYPPTTTEAGDPLRPLLFPSTLRATFLALAHPNTLSNLETCGILAATLQSSTLKITHLLLPAQHSTSETCDTTPAGDAALFDYCDAHALLVCGWIHTHPSQSCFLSSRDLHTSSGYQVMMPEAIAIVCAPRHEPAWGVFRLTAPPGLQAVLGCRDEGVFHPHAEEGLYTDALRPGHVVERAGLEFEVVDLRKG
ncbi:hypothetical protein B0A54_05388 [Friedmanniomyces endolithicus]|uniref:MPN domain-containing protein n=1 Tax=Friedmanniomyces endolithicus TaxID=329885 RepID=A0A4U0V6U6_9PEZI|nr:hypothetical protein LTS09_010862 [Friedmanniomyces endolithicus]TKA43606.1 hypothetical protein B0A54_05388 [Friedmanniomyces endolithicus]